MLKSYSDLYTQIEKLISERVGVGVEIQPRHVLTSGARAESADISEIVTTIMQELGEIVESRIISGLAVTANSPPSATVTVASGKGTAGAKLYELESDTDVKIPLDNTTYIYYIHLFSDSAYVRRDKPNDHCVLAKIVVPKPGVTSRIVDDKPTNGYDGWVVSARDAFFDQDQEFDDDSKEVIKNALSEIAAEVIFGTLTASENLTITNVLGTMRVDSQAMSFFDGEGNELAYYGADYARVGNIKILTDRLVSRNYVSERSGFVIRDDGFAEFENVRIRGRLSSSVFEYDKISAVGGKLLVGNSSVLAAGVSSEDTTITMEDPLFSVGDILNIRDGIDVEYMEVTDASDAPTYTVTRDIANAYVTDPDPVWNKGMAVVSTGNGLSGQQTGFISLDAVSSHAPFIDINYRLSTTYNDWETKVRLGNLAGIVDSDYGTLSGFGLYSDNVYLKGEIWASAGVFTGTIKVGSAGNVYIDGANEVIKVYDESNNLRVEIGKLS